MLAYGMLEDELRAILRDLASNIDALSVAIAVMPDDHDSKQSGNATHREIPLGHGSMLLVNLARPADDAIKATIERTARSLRSTARRWGIELFPAIRASTEPTTTKDQVLDRMRSFLAAFCGSAGADVAAVVHKGELVASSSPLTELQSERLAFTVKLADAEAQKAEGSSHAVLFGEDYFVATFYYDAALVAYTSRPAAPDFVRHHAKQLTRELVHLLELLDDNPPDPAHVNPV
ncbi:MAG: hypothetical protein KJO07_01150 [Deltaproteobacteria bacterium]|nr:hypothetical protein [Deltaproteobacteria bacterium]